jgi:hypothetical protein
VACERVSSGSLGTCPQIKDIAFLIVGDPTELVRADVYGHRFQRTERGHLLIAAKRDGAARPMHGTLERPDVTLASPPADPHTLLHTVGGQENRFYLPD